jgi:hypothetical protein
MVESVPPRLKLSYRPMSADDVGQVPLAHQGDEREVLERIATIGSSAWLAFDDSRHIGQIQFRRYQPETRPPNGVWVPVWWMDFADHAPHLDPLTLASAVVMSVRSTTRLIVTRPTSGEALVRRCSITSSTGHARTAPRPSSRSPPRPSARSWSSWAGFPPVCIACSVGDATARVVNHARMTRPRVCWLIAGGNERHGLAVREELVAGDRRDGEAPNSSRWERITQAHGGSRVPESRTAVSLGAQHRGGSEA